MSFGRYLADSGRYLAGRVLEWIVSSWAWIAKHSKCVGHGETPESLLELETVSNTRSDSSPLPGDIQVYTTANDSVEVKTVPGRLDIKSNGDVIVGGTGPCRTVNVESSGSAAVFGSRLDEKQADSVRKNMLRLEEAKRSIRARQLEVQSSEHDY